MTTARNIGIADATFIAGQDFSTCGIYRFVSAGSVQGEVVLATGTCNPMPIGVIQNSPSTGQEAAVRTLGFSKVQSRVDASGCYLEWRRYIYTASDGVAQSACITGSPVNGYYLDQNVTSGSVYAQVLLFAFTASFAAAS